MKILWIEDEVSPVEGTTLSGAFARFVGLKKVGSNHGVDTHLYLSGSGSCNIGDFASDNGCEIPEVGNLPQLRMFLSTVDIVILDLDAGEWTWGAVKKETLEARLRAVDPDGRVGEITQEEATAITGMSGVAFLHAFAENLQGKAAVFVLTKQLEAHPLLTKLLDPFCTNNAVRPPVSRYPKTEEGYRRVFDRTAMLIQLAGQGYTSLESLFEIELAASHSLPVMLVGESGTGKEYLARAIHVRWAQERIADGSDAGVVDRFAAINCAMLDNDLGSVELFGAVAGAYTGLNDHNVGRILGDGCGVKLLPGSRTTKGDRDIQDLVKRSAGRLSQGRDGVVRVSRLEGTSSSYRDKFGTLFLDEFGDLPAGMQTKMLRFLDGGEFPMLGMPGGGKISGADLRIITATSDSRVAEFAGFYDTTTRLKGQIRTEGERARPFRTDLLFRVQGQAIRASPVTRDNVERITRQFLANRPLKANQLSQPVWEEGAIQCLVARLCRQIEAVEAADRSGARPVFGHRREIRRTVDLCDAYVSGAIGRGERSSEPPGVVTAWLVERLHTPGMFLGESNSGSSPSGGREYQRSGRSAGNPLAIELAERIRGLTSLEEWNFAGLMLAFRNSRHSDVKRELRSLIRLDHLKQVKRRLQAEDRLALAIALGFDVDASVDDGQIRKHLKAARDAVEGV